MAKNNGQKMSTTKGFNRNGYGQSYRVASQAGPNNSDSCAVAALALLAGLSGLWEVFT